MSREFWVCTKIKCVCTRVCINPFFAETWVAITVGVHEERHNKLIHFIC